MMTDSDNRQHRSILRRIAHRAMLERGLAPDFPPQALAELDGIHGPATRTAESTRDLRNLPWCSIDNDDSRDLDQLTVAEALPDGAAKSAAALLLESRIGEKFDAIVTGASDKGTWVRLLHPPIEGRLESGFEGVDIGHRLRVQLARTDVERGYIDFRRVA